MPFLIKIKKSTLIINYIIIFTLIVSNAGAVNGLTRNSRIDWQKGYVISRGSASVMFSGTGTPVDIITGEKKSLNSARELSYIYAREAAVQRMTDAIKSIRVDSRTRISDIIETNASFQRILTEVINNNTSYREFPSGFDSTSCEARLNFGSIISALPYEYPSNDFPVRAEIPVATSYTGLIVDCRDTDIAPMLFPSIYSDEGLEIYGKNYIESSFASRGGMISYCNSEEQALTDPRAGEHPYFAVSMKTINGCPVLLEKDVRRIMASRYTLNNLKRCRVMFIINTKGVK